MYTHLKRVGYTVLRTTSLSLLSSKKISSKSNDDQSEKIAEKEILLKTNKQIVSNTMFTKIFGGLFIQGADLPFRNILNRLFNYFDGKKDERKNGGDKQMVVEPIVKSRSCSSYGNGECITQYIRHD